MSHYEYKSRIRRDFMKVLMKSWHNTLRRYEKAWGKADLAYVYGEQANLGLLAIAAERAGALPFLEFSTDKGPTSDSYQGRCDLQIVTHRKQRWDIEAKRVQERVTKKNLQKIVHDALADAAKDVRALSFRSKAAIGIVFVIPFGIKRVEDDWRKFTELMTDLDTLEADFCALHLCREDIWAKSPHDDCPGIAIIGHYVS